MLQQKQSTTTETRFLKLTNNARFTPTEIFRC